MARELYTWMLGNRFVGVSDAYSRCTMCTKMLSLANVSGRSSCPFGHTGDQEDTEPPAQFSICKCDKDNASCHVDKPQVVRNDKKLAKWNVVIQCHVNDMEIGIDVYFFLKPAEPRNIDQRV